MILDGKALSLSLQQTMKEQIARLSTQIPSLAFILIGDHPASKTYVKAKQKACSLVGITSHVIEFSDEVKEQEVLHTLQRLNSDPQINAILVQQPMPKHLNTRHILQSIDPKKDVDGFHPINMGKLLLGDPSGMVPCTPLGIQTLLHHANISCEGKHVVIVGRSNIVGKPLAALLVQKSPLANATVTIAHSHSQNLHELTRSADILISATGTPHSIRKEMVAPNAVVIDVGIHRSSTGKLIGDVDFDGVAKIASYITPVPGGIGPMTIAMLLQNTLRCFELHQNN